MRTDTNDEGTGPGTADVVVLTFTDEDRGREFVDAAARLAKRRDLTLQDAAMVVRADDGSTRVVETRDLSPGEGALEGGVLGLLLGLVLGGPIGGAIGGAVGAGSGAVVARLIDTGLDDAFLDELRDAVPRGSAGVALLGSGFDEDAFHAEVRRFDASLLRTSLTGAARDSLDDAIADGHRFMTEGDDA
jgi:uncharacterized membrane protein